MAPLNVLSPVTPPSLKRVCDVIARPPLDERDVRAAGPAHMCQQEDVQLMNMSHHELHWLQHQPEQSGCKGFRQARAWQGHWI